MWRARCRPAAAPAAAAGARGAAAAAPPQREPAARWNDYRSLWYTRQSHLVGFVLKLGSSERESNDGCCLVPMSRITDAIVAVVKVCGVSNALRVPLIAARPRRHTRRSAPPQLRRAIDCPCSALCSAPCRSAAQSSSSSHNCGGPQCMWVCALRRAACLRALQRRWGLAPSCGGRQPLTHWCARHCRGAACVREQCPCKFANL